MDRLINEITDMLPNLTERRLRIVAAFIRGFFRD